MEITREQLDARKARYQQLAADYARQVAALEGAIQAVDEIINELFPPDAVTIPELGRMIGAKEIGEPEAV